MKIDYSKDQRKKLINSVYDGNVNSKKLPQDLYNSISSALVKSVRKGFGDVHKYENDSYDNKLEEFEANVKLFAAAKVYQEVSAMEEVLKSSGSLEEFTSAAEHIEELYNTTWMDTELSTAAGWAAMGEKWVTIEAGKELFPYLRYVLVENTPCEICPPLDGVILPVDDPFWDEFSPLNHFNCACLIEQVDEFDKAELDEIGNSLYSVINKVKVTAKSKLNAIRKKISGRMSPIFKHNAGKSGMIFNKDHPYFHVDDKNFAKKNFGLKIK